MRIFDLAYKDLLQLLRDWKAALFLVAMPIAFTVFFGFMFGGAGSGEDPRLPVGLVDLDPGGRLSAGLAALLENSNTIRVESISAATSSNVSKLVTDGDLAAVIQIPEGFTEATLAGNTVALTAILDDSSPDGQTIRAILQTAVSRLRGAAKTAQLSAEAYARNREFEDDTERQAYVLDAIERAIQAWKQPPLIVTVEQATAIEAEDGSPYGDNAFAHSSPGMMIQFAIVGLIGSAEMLVSERKTRALGRLLTTPISRLQVLAGHLLAMFIVVFLQLLLLVVFADLALGLGYFRAPAATLLLTALMALWSATLGLLIGILAKSSEQVTIYALIPMFVFSALGGAWMPLEFTSATFSTIGHLTPTAWAIDGFKNIVIRGMGIGSVWLPAAILLAWSALFVALSIWRFKPE